MELSGYKISGTSLLASKIASLLRGTEFSGTACWLIQLMCHAIRSLNSTNSSSLQVYLSSSCIFADSRNEPFLHNSYVTWGTPIF